MPPGALTSQDGRLQPLTHAGYWRVRSGESVAASSDFQLDYADFHHLFIKSINIFFNSIKFYFHNQSISVFLKIVFDVNKPFRPEFHEDGTERKEKRANFSRVTHGREGSCQSFDWRQPAMRANFKQISSFKHRKRH